MRLKKIPRSRLYLYFAAILAVFSACGSGPGGDSSDKSTSRPAKREIKAPAFALVDLKGQKFKLEDFKGKVVFLDFWATWCPPCVMSVPEVMKLNEDYHAKGVEVISISLDQVESPVREFVARRKITNRVAIAGSSSVADDYAVEGIPAFYLIDGNGLVVRGWSGYNPMMPRAWRKELDRLLKT